MILGKISKVIPIFFPKRYFSTVTTFEQLFNGPKTQHFPYSDVLSFVNAKEGLDMEQNKLLMGKLIELIKSSHYDTKEIISLSHALNQKGVYVQNLFPLMIDCLIQETDKELFMKALKLFEQKMKQDQNEQLEQKILGIIGEMDLGQLIEHQFIVRKNSHIKSSWVSLFVTQFDQMSPLLLLKLVKQPLIEDKLFQENLENYIITNMESFDFTLLRQTLNYIDNVQFEQTQNVLEILQNTLKSVQIKTQLKIDPYIITFAESLKKELSEQEQEAYTKSYNTFKTYLDRIFDFTKIMDILHYFEIVRLPDPQLYELLELRIRFLHKLSPFVVSQFLKANYFIPVDIVLECCEHSKNDHLNSKNIFNLQYLHQVACIYSLYDPRFQNYINHAQDEIISNKFKVDFQFKMKFLSNVVLSRQTSLNTEFLDYLLKDLNEQIHANMQYLYLFLILEKLKHLHYEFYLDNIEQVRGIINKGKALFQKQHLVAKSKSQSFFEENVYKELNKLQDVRILRNHQISCFEIDFVLLDQNQRRRVFLEIDGKTHKYVNKQIYNFKSLQKKNILLNLHQKKKIHTKFFRINQFTWNNHRNKLLKNICAFLQQN